MWYIYTMQYFFSHKKEQNYAICRKIDGTGDHQVKPDSERQILHVFYHMWNPEKKTLHESRRETTKFPFSN
jgi:hypothetical protein